MRNALACLLCGLMVVGLAACAGEAETNAPGEADEAAESSTTTNDYRVVFGSALTDTLRGRAAFGTVVEPESGRARFVIRLASDFDFAGGVIIARRDTTVPAPGTYSFDLAADSLAQAATGDFLLFYREGMQRDMRASSGSLTLSSVTDTMIVGTFDVNLRGRIAGTDRSGPGTDVRAVGRFRAAPDLRGFVIGL